MLLRAMGVVGVLASTLVVLMVAYPSGSDTESSRASAATFAAAQPVRELLGVEPTGSNVIRLTAAGDHGGRNSRGGQTLNLVRALAPVAHLALGDLSYSDRVPESEWCDWVINGDESAGVSGVGSIPVQVVGGNHEEDSRSDGFIRNFAACLPDRLDSVGDYGVEYYIDIAGMVRVIMIAADVAIDGEDYDYGSGPHRKWLQQAVLGARAAGIPWVVVGMHKVCVTTATKSCEVGESVMDWLLAPGRADVILQGHDHGVQRSHQLRCVDVNVSTPGCIVDTDGDHLKGNGGVILIGGSFGRSSYSQDPNDPESGYFAAWMSDEGSPGSEQQGLWQLDFSSTSLKARWIGSTSDYEDAVQIAAPPPEAPPAGGGPSSGDPNGDAAVTASKVAVALVSQRVTRRGKARFRVSCPAGEQGSLCKGVLRLKTQQRLPNKRQGTATQSLRRVTLGSKRFAIPAGQTRTVAVKLLRRHRGRLTRAGLRVRAVVIGRDAVGKRYRVRRAVRLRQASPQR